MITVKDILPVGLTATAVSGVGWTVNPSTLVCTRPNPLIAGAGAPPIFVTVSVAANATATVTNTATVASVDNSNTANDTNLDVTIVNPAVIGGNLETLVSW